MAKKIFSILLSTMLLLVPMICSASDTVAVIPFHKKASVSAELTLDDEDYAAELVNEYLTNANRFDIVDREYLKETLDEQDLAMSGFVDPSTASNIGMLVGAKYIVVGSITGLSSVNKVGKVAGVGGKSFKVVAHLSARMIEVESGRVLTAANGIGTSTAHLVEAPFRLIRIGEAEVSQEQVYDAIDKAAADLVKKMLVNLDNRR
ncbi:MAG: hypothetical protein IJ668_01715 [Selenomonadaceae bacterium]|nr:hypothetical protein [Selenomonadaceae bacterium]